MEHLKYALETINRDKKTPFNSWNKINRAKTTFVDNPKIKRGGKEVNLQKYIDENNQDCTIYQVYEKYRGDKKLTAAALNTLSHTISDELTEINDLPTAFMAMAAAEKAWKKLPLKVREEFGNDINRFQKTGISWAQEKIKAYETMQEAQKPKDTVITVPGETINQKGVVANG